MVAVTQCVTLYAIRPSERVLMGRVSVVFVHWFVAVLLHATRAGAQWSNFEQFSAKVTTVGGFLRRGCFYQPRNFTAVVGAILPESVAERKIPSDHSGRFFSFLPPKLLLLVRN